MMKVASQRLTRASFRLISPSLLKWFADLKRLPCKCWQDQSWSLHI